MTSGERKRVLTPARAREERSAGGVVIRRVGHSVDVLLIRDPYENWGLPKGHVERRESAEDAALREVLEETGLVCRVVGEALQTIDWFFRDKGVLVHKFCQFYLMESSDGEPVPATGEGISDCRWFPLDVAIREITYSNAREVIVEAARILDLDDDEAA